MSTLLTAVYQGEGVLRLMDQAADLKTGEKVQLLVLPVRSLPAARPSLPDRIQAVYDDMGLLEIADPKTARQLAEDDSLLEWNLPL